MNENVIKLNRNNENRSIIKDRFIRAKQLEQIFVGISKSTFTEWANKGIITRYKIQGSTFYKESEILRLIESSRITN